MILITTPDTNMLGGVASFYKNLNLETYDNVSYFFIQNDSDQLSPLKKIITYPKRFLSFFSKCSKASTIIINPSFSKKSIWRDAVYLFIAKNIFKRKTIIFWHGWDEDLELRIKNSFIYRFILQKHFSTVSQTIVLSELFIKKLQTFGYPVNHNFHLSSVAADNFDTTLPPIERKYEDLKVIKLLFLSRIVSEKGIYIALDVMDELINKKGITDIQLTVAGEGPELAQAKAIVKQKHLENYIQFAGFIKGDEKARLLFDSHLLIFPTSFCEGMPVSILESMLYGLYIMASARGGIIDIITEANGNLFNKVDSDTYVNKIVELLNNKSKIKKIGIFNHQYAMSNYSSGIVKRKLYQLFNDQSSNNGINRKFKERADVVT